MSWRSSADLNLSYKNDPNEYCDSRTLSHSPVPPSVPRYPREPVTLSYICPFNSRSIVCLCIPTQVICSEINEPEMRCQNCRSYDRASPHRSHFVHSDPS